MNGRIYDPLLGRFLSADTQVQFPSSLQSYNRYSYVRNNPLTTTDPTGFGETSEDDDSKKKAADNRKAVADNAPKQPKADGRSILTNQQRPPPKNQQPQQSAPRPQDVYAAIDFGFNMLNQVLLGVVVPMAEGGGATETTPEVSTTEEVAAVGGETAAATETVVAATADEPVPMTSGTLYRSGGNTPATLTPRPVTATHPGDPEGLSTFTSIEAAMKAGAKPGQKFQTLDASKIDAPLVAVPDAPRKGMSQFDPVSTLHLKCDKQRLTGLRQETSQVTGQIIR